MSESLVVDDSKEDVSLKLSPSHSTVHPLIPVIVVASYAEKEHDLAIV